MTAIETRSHSVRGRTSGFKSTAKELVSVFIFWFGSVSYLGRDRLRSLGLELRIKLGGQSQQFQTELVKFVAVLFLLQRLHDRQRISRGRQSACLGVLWVFRIEFQDEGDSLRVHRFGGGFDQMILDL